jgi:hypothetical protein
LVRLDGAALLACKILQPTACGVEGLTDGDGRIAVRALGFRPLTMRVFTDVFQSSMQ